MPTIDIPTRLGNDFLEIGYFKRHDPPNWLETVGRTGWGANAWRGTRIRNPFNSRANDVYVHLYHAARNGSAYYLTTVTFDGNDIDIKIPKGRNQPYAVALSASCDRLRNLLSQLAANQGWCDWAQTPDYN